MTKLALQHIIDWSNGEAYFAITQGARIIRRLPSAMSDAQRRQAYRDARAATI